MKGARTKPVLEELETKIIDLAKGIKTDFSQGFKRLGTGRDCEYCEFRFYCK